MQLLRYYMYMHFLQLIGPNERNRGINIRTSKDTKEIKASTLIKPSRISENLSFFFFFSSSTYIKGLFFVGPGTKIGSHLGKWSEWPWIRRKIFQYARCTSNGCMHDWLSSRDLIHSGETNQNFEVELKTEEGMFWEVKGWHFSIFFLKEIKQCYDL